MSVAKALASAAATALLTWSGDSAAALQGGSTKVFENDRVVIWSLASDGREQTSKSRLPGVLITLNDGAVRFVDPAAAPRLREPVRQRDARTDDSSDAVLIELKEAPAAPLSAPSGVGPAFPRQGARRVIENSRIVVWDLTWRTGMKTAVHFHDKDVVAVYLGTGTVRSIPLDGEPTATPRSFGEAVFLPRGRTHVEECIEGPRRDIIIELK
jgi:hypothetical protein